MKKLFALAIAAIIALSMVVFAAAAVADDAKQVVDDIIAAVGVDKAKAAIQAEFDKYSDVDLLNVDAIPAGTSDAMAAGLIDKLGLDPDGTLAEKITGAMSNDFVSFLAGIYVDVDTTEPVIIPPTDVDDETTPVIVTGGSPVIAIAAFATVSAAAAVAFVCLKKKED